MIVNEGGMTVRGRGISSWADWSVQARPRNLLSGLVTNPGGGIDTRGSRGVRGRGVSGAEESRSNPNRTKRTLVSLPDRRSGELADGLSQWRKRS